MTFTKGEIFLVSIDATLALMFGVILLFVGIAVNKRVAILRKFCIPPAVTGGLIFSIINLFLYKAGIVEFEFDDTLTMFFLGLFFTAVGFSAGLGVLKKSRKLVVILLLSTVVLTFGQDLIAVGLSKVMGIHPLLGLMAGSPALVGGHGNAAAFGKIAEGWGHSGAVVFGLAASTYGLIAGVIFGNPTAEWLIKRHKLPIVPDEIEGFELDSKPKSHEFNPKAMQTAFFLIVLALGIGILLQFVWSNFFPNISIVSFVWGLAVSIIFRIVCDARKIKLPEVEIKTLETTFLALFVTLAVGTMQLWQLIDLALPLLVILVANTVFTLLFVVFVTYYLCGKNYDSACIASGQIGFGMGSAIVSLANIDGLSQKYVKSNVAFIIVPIVGALLSNITNAFIINAFMNFFH